jgi:hypothetical protein
MKIESACFVYPLNPGLASFLLAAASCWWDGAFLLPPSVAHFPANIYFCVLPCVKSHFLPPLLPTPTPTRCLQSQRIARILISPSYWRHLYNIKKKAFRAAELCSVHSAHWFHFHSSLLYSTISPQSSQQLHFPIIYNIQCRPHSIGSITYNGFFEGISADWNLPPSPTTSLLNVRPIEFPRIHQKLNAAEPKRGQNGTSASQTHKSSISNREKRGMNDGDH